MTARPGGQAAVDAIERQEGAVPRRFTLDRAKVSGVQPSHRGQPALFERCQAFDLPCRQQEIRKRERRPAKHRTHPARPAARSIEVDDVGVLVREDQLEPVVRVADQFRAGRGGGADGDGVIRNRRRPAVGELRLVDQDDVRFRLHRHAERRLQPEPRLLRNSRHPGGEAFLSAMKVDDEVLGRDRPEPQPWIESGRRGQRSGGQHRDDQANELECRRAPHAGENGNRRLARDEGRRGPAGRWRSSSCATS